MASKSPMEVAGLQTINYTGHVDLDYATLLDKGTQLHICPFLSERYSYLSELYTSIGSTIFNRSRLYCIHGGSAEDRSAVNDVQ